MAAAAAGGTDAAAAKASKKAAKKAAVAAAEDDALTDSSAASSSSPMVRWLVWYVVPLAEGAWSGLDESRGTDPAQHPQPPHPPPRIGRE